MEPNRSITQYHVERMDAKIMWSKLLPKIGMNVGEAHLNQ